MAGCSDLQLGGWGVPSTVPGAQERELLSKGRSGAKGTGKGPFLDKSDGELLGRTQEVK